ncbi:hypothetical protein ASG89_21670 [Paenibacillus sp. Soil766]|uniref:hypothetical protein n=1 Tax=Paenibacillus sp. Soil766 TaxID=1736404 RepID=UPI00070A19F6|nr:hypothetical protein [Paenibacillus sp. Soil766]KRF04458.1 hypothetical protein ASG89_21670 [Paenibacillus sp. Soil766]
MIRKTLKLMIVSLSLSIPLAMGTAAYAYTDAGSTLQVWGKLGIQLDKHEISEKLQQNTVTALQTLTQVKDEGVAHAGAQIEQTAVDAGHKASKSIVLAQQTYEAQLDGIAIELTKSSSENFNMFVQASSSRMSKDLEEWASEAIQGLTEQLSN